MSKIINDDMEQLHINLKACDSITVRNYVQKRTRSPFLYVLFHFAKGNKEQSIPDTEESSKVIEDYLNVQ